MNISDLIAYIDAKLADNHKRLIIPSVHRDVLHYLVNGLNATVFNINSSQVTDNGDGTYAITVTNPLDDALAIDEKLNIYEYNGTAWTLKFAGLGGFIASASDNGDDTYTFTSFDGNTSFTIAIPILSVKAGPGIDVDVSDPKRPSVGLDQASQDSLDLADSAVQKDVLPIFLQDRGVSHLNDAATNTLLIQNAIIEAELYGRPVCVPFVPDGSFIDIDSAIEINTGNIKVFGYGASSRIRQTVYPKSIFLINSENVEIADISFHGVPFNAAGGGSAHTEYSAVWVTNLGHNSIIRNIVVDTMSTAINIRSGVPKAENVTINGVYCTNIVFGILSAASSNLHIKNVVGTHKMIGNAPTPPHLIYLADNQPPYSNTGTVIEDCHCISGEYSSAYQFKGVHNAIFRNLSAIDSNGLAKFENVNNFTASSLISHNDLKTGFLYGSVEFTNSSNGVIKYVFIEKGVDGEAISFFTPCSNIIVKDIEIRSNLLASYSGHGDAMIDVRGDNCEIINANIINTGLPAYAGITVFSGNDNRIINPRVSGHNYGLAVRGNETYGTLIRYRKADVANNNIYPIYAGALITVDRGFDESVIDYDFMDSVGLNNNINSTSYGSMWNKAFGVWKVDADGFTSADALALANVETQQTNIKVEAEVMYNNREAICLRSIDKNNNIECLLNHISNEAQISIRITGLGSTAIAQTAFTPQIGRWYKYTASIYDDIVQFSVDGVLLCEATLSPSDSSHFDGVTTHGINTYGGGYFRNIKWISI